MASQATAILVILDPLIRARYPDAAARLTDLQRLADAAAAQPSLHDALAELTLDPPVSASDLAGPPRLDEDYLTISTIHAAKGLEWPIVHLPHLVDGALPSDMALGDPGGLAEEHRLFYVAITRARDHLYLYAPQRLHYHRRGRDDRHGFGQLTRFLHPEALAACDNATAAPLAPVLPAVGPLTVTGRRRPRLACGTAEGQLNAAARRRGPTRFRTAARRVPSEWPARWRSSRRPRRIGLARPYRRRAGRTGAWRAAGRRRRPGSGPAPPPSAP